MKACVTVKRVVDYNVKIQVKPDHSSVDTSHVKMSMNPFDEIAVEEAVKLKEQGIIKEIIAISIGTEKSEETLRTALAMGADKGILVTTHENLSPLHIAKLLKAIIKEQQPDITLMGKQAIDDDYNQTGQMLAALLGWPQATFASKLHIKDKQVEVTRETDQGLETIAVTLPAIITTDLRLNEPRYVSLPNIMKARSKPIETISAESFGINFTPKLHIIKVEDPPARTGGIKVDSIEALVDILKEKGALS